jgi:hypothetical protein
VALDCCCKDFVAFTVGDVREVGALKVQPAFVEFMELFSFIPILHECFHQHHQQLFSLDSAPPLALTRPSHVSSPSCIVSSTSSAVVTVGVCDCVRSVSSTYENQAISRVSPDRAVL